MTLPTDEAHERMLKAEKYAKVQAPENLKEANDTVRQIEQEIKARKEYKYRLFNSMRRVKLAALARAEARALTLSQVEANPEQVVELSEEEGESEAEADELAVEMEMDSAAVEMEMDSAAVEAEEEEADVVYGPPPSPFEQPAQV